MNNLEKLSETREQFRVLLSARYSYLPSGEIVSVYLSHTDHIGSESGLEIMIRALFAS